MFDVFASFVYRNRRRVLLVALLGIAVAGVFGLGVAKRLSPYGDTDPSTQSVQATNRYQAATRTADRPGRGRARDRRRRPQRDGRAPRRGEVEAQLRSSRDVATVSSYYDSHDSGDAVPRRALDLRRRVLPAEVGPADPGRRDSAWRASSPASVTSSSAAARSPTRRSTRRSAATSHAPSCSRSRSSSCSRCCSSARWSPRCCRRCSAASAILAHLLRAADRLELHRPVGVRLNIVTGLGLGLAIDYSLFMVSRYREEAARRGFGVDALRRTLATAGRTIAFSSLTVAAALASLTIFPQNFLFSMGTRRGRRRARRRHARARRAAGDAGAARTTRQRPRAEVAPARRRPRRATRRDGLLVPAVAVRDRAPRQDRTAHRGGADRARHAVRVDQVPARRRQRAARKRERLSRRRGTCVLEFPPGRTSPLEIVVGAPAGSAEVTRTRRTHPRTPRRVRGRAAAARPGRTALAARRRSGDADVRRASRTARRQDVALCSSTPFYRRRRGRYRGIRGPRTEPRARTSPSCSRSSSHRRWLVLFLMTGSFVLGVKAVLMNALSLSAVFGILVLIFQQGRLQGPLGYRQHWRARRDPADSVVRNRLRARHRLQRHAALADQGGARQRHTQRPSCGDRARAHGTDHHRRRAPVRRRNRGVRHVEAGLHQGARPRHRTRGTDRRHPRPRPARALADGAARRVELVGTRPTATTWRADIRRFA